MITRKISSAIAKNLDKPDILLITGARQVGKTTVLKELVSYLKKRNRETYFFTLEDPDLLTDLNQHPENIFNYVPKNSKYFFLLLDEVQYLNNPTNFLKYIYDLYREKIKLIVSGSSAFYIDYKFRDSLAGRKKIIELYPFCFSEFLLAKKETKLSEKIAQENYFDRLKKVDLLKHEIRKLRYLWQEYSIFGGYPRVVLEDNLDEKKYILKEIYQSFLRKDIREAGIKNELKFYMLLKILASQVGQLSNIQELSNTIDVSNDTVSKYIYTLQKSFIIKQCAPFYRNIRKELTKMPKIFFLDNGYRNSLLNLFDPISQRIDNGAVLENIFFTELVKLSIDDIKFWRTQSKSEVDFIVNERYAFELKVSKKAYNMSKYKKFIDRYPEISLRLVTHQDENNLDLLDFAS